MQLNFISNENPNRSHALQSRSEYIRAGQQSSGEGVGAETGIQMVTMNGQPAPEVSLKVVTGAPIQLCLMQEEQADHTACSGLLF